MFSNWFLKSFRILLFPFALLYGLGVLLRNWLYDRKILKSASFGLPLISVGNLAVGGTGKSPMVEFLVQRLQRHYRVATLSRGYKRKTRGYVLANEHTTAIEIGDEPMQFHKKFPDVPVAVGEERIVAIPQLLHDRPGVQVIILDDAFQHREIRAGLNILLTDHGNLFTRDFFLPAGDLRDSRSSYRRADMIIVTKCPPGLSPEARTELIREIKPLPHQKVYFTSIHYGLPYHIHSRVLYRLDHGTEVLLVAGIANPAPIKKYLEEMTDAYSLLQYADHHIFTIDDLNDITRKFSQMNAGEKIILTTEKDAMRLQKFEQKLDGMPFYIIPIEHKFLFDQEHEFINAVVSFIDNYKISG